jgi:hypothetical protein
MKYLSNRDATNANTIKKNSDVRTALHAEQARNRQVEEDGGMKAVRYVGRSS